MAKDTSNGIRDFVKNALKTYYDNFQVKLADSPRSTDINPTIKMDNDGSIYIYNVGGYDGTNIQDASSLQSIIKDNTITITPGANISTQKGNQSLTISALGYIYNQEKNSFAELNSNTASGNNSHAEGSQTKASGQGSHTEGWNTHAKADYSHAEGMNTKAIGKASHAEGYNNTVVGERSHAEGGSNKNYSKYGHAEGADNTIGIEGTDGTINGYKSHAEGSSNTVTGNCSHAEGSSNTASGNYSHAEGNKAKASGDGSHAEGYYTEAKNSCEHASGMYNKSNNKDENSQTIFSIGIGTSDTDRKNAIEVFKNGQVFIEGIGGYDGTNPTESNTLQGAITKARIEVAGASVEQSFDQPNNYLYIKGDDKFMQLLVTGGSHLVIQKYCKMRSKNSTGYTPPKKRWANITCPYECSDSIQFTDSRMFKRPLFGLISIKYSQSGDEYADVPVGAYMPVGIYSYDGPNSVNDISQSGMYLMTPKDLLLNIVSPLCREDGLVDRNGWKQSSIKIGNDMISTIIRNNSWNMNNCRPLHFKFRLFFTDDTGYSMLANENMVPDEHLLTNIVYFNIYGRPESLNSSQRYNLKFVVQ